MNLSEKMTAWAELQAQAKRLEDEIIAEVLPLGKTQSLTTEHGIVTASYRKSSTNGSFDYESMVKEVEPDQEIVDRHTQTKIIIDWKAIADECVTDAALKDKYYTKPAEGQPSVTLKLK